jgi:hypothetical protein
MDLYQALNIIQMNGIQSIIKPKEIKLQWIAPAIALLLACLD